MGTRMDRRAPMLAAVLAILIFIPSSMLAQRNCCEGDSWLRWSPEHRNDYVRGYIRGYYGGYFQGCQQGTKYSSGTVKSGPEKSPIDECLDRKLDFTKGTELSNEITRFYRRYPENRILLINEILEELGKGRSIEDIHNHPPFPAHNSSKGTNATNERRK
jgi:hypothetical protein